MYSLLDSGSRAASRQAQFTAALQTAAHDRDARLARVRCHVGSRSGDVIPVRDAGAHPRVRTLARDAARCRSPAAAPGASVHFDERPAVPGAARGRAAHPAHVTLPPRARCCASDGTPLAEGPGRTSPIPDVAGQIVGHARPDPGRRSRPYAALGLPAGRQGRAVDGLERVFQTSSRAPRAARCWPAPACWPARLAARRQRRCTTTIDPAARAGGGRGAGRALRRDRGDGSPHRALLALAGVAFSALQPPGSTMKIVTASGALEAGIVKLERHVPDPERRRPRAASTSRTPTARCAAARC